MSAGRQITVLNHKNLSPPDGGTLRIQNFISGLASRGHDVSFAYWGSRERETFGTHIVNVRKPPARFLQRLASMVYGGEEGKAAVELLLCNYPTMFMKLHPNLKTSSVLQAEQIWSAAIPLLYRKMFNKVTVLDDHNVEALLAQRLYPYVKNKSTYSYWMKYVSLLERTCCNLADQIIVTSDIDKVNLEKFHKISQNKISVIPNGSDVNKYRPDCSLCSGTRMALGIGETDQVLTYVGRGTYPPNKMAIDYIKDTLAPKIWEEFPNARFMIVSRDLPADYFGSDNRFIHITDDYDYPFINASDICLAPLAVGGGTRIKIANYLACGKPVVSTPMGCEGIPARHMKEIVLSSMEEFPSSVKALIQNPSTRDEMGRKAREFAVSNCSWEKSILELDRLYSGLWSKNAN